METPTEDVKPIETTALFGLRVVDLQRRYRLGYVPAKALYDDLALHRWRAIETAPSDGSVFLAFVPHAEVGFAFAAVITTDGRLACMMSGDDFTGRATHWMPMPSLPNVQADPR